MKMTRKDINRLRSRIVLPDDLAGCWVWNGAHTGSGYAAFWINGRTIQAHRVTYEFFIGPVPDGLMLDHLCRNRGCVNPAHLEPVTCAVNIRRGISHNGSKTHCKYGHELTPDNIIRSVARPGRRICRECNRIQCIKQYNARKHLLGERAQ